MIRWFRQLDSVLRGESTSALSLKDGQFTVPMRGVLVVAVVLAVVYGLCMGSFAMIRTGGAAQMQLIASAAKLPALFLLTLVVTFPSLYVFNALIGSRLTIRSCLRLISASMGVMLAVLSSLGPIVVFFAVSTTSYSFMVLLNVAASTVAGMLGLLFMLRTLGRVVRLQAGPAGFTAPGHVTEYPPPAQGADFPPPLPSGAGSLDRMDAPDPRRARTVFKVWTFVFALVGAQMSWVLRPFIGDPNQPFEWFRAREGNFFLAVLTALQSLFS